MFFSLIFSLVFLPGLLSGQHQFAPPGAGWCLSGYDGNGETLGYVLVSYERDTLIDQQLTKIFSVRTKVFGPRGLEETYYSPVELFQQSGDSVFYYVPVIRDQVYLFKENYIAGEETVSWLHREPFFVESVEETLMGSKSVPVAKMDLVEWLGRELPVTMYGSIGPSRGFVESWSFFLEGKGGLNLEAYRADTIPEIKILPRSQCFALMETVDERDPFPVGIENCKLIAYPNPVTSVIGQVQIRFDCGKTASGDFSMRIFNVQGQAVAPLSKIEGIPADFSVRELPPGKYFAIITGEEERYHFSFTKIR